MSLVEHYKIVEIDLPVVTTACTINGNPGFGTPISCLDQKDTFSPVNRIYRFTDTALILPVSDIYKQLKSVAETTPKLKAGLGLGSRSTASIMFEDFVDDPNLDSPALVASPSTRRNGTYFGKLNERQFLINKSVRVQYWERENGVDTKIKTNNYIATDFKRTKDNLWILSCKDVLYKTNKEKSQFPKLVTTGKNRLTADITDSATSVTFDGDVADWDETKHIAVIGSDLLPITSISGSSTSVTLTVTRPTTITLGARTYNNTPEAHDDGDEVFRGRFFENASLDDVLFAIFEDAGLETSEFDGPGITAELDDWLLNLKDNIDCIYYEPDDSDDVLETICKEFLFDIWTDILTGKVQVSATSVWNTSVATLTEGKEINYDTLIIDEPDKLQFSRAYLQYDKRNLTANDDDVQFRLSSVAANLELEGEFFYDEEKVKRLGKSIILSNSSTNIESGDLTVIRFAQRFSNRPKIFTFDVEEKNLIFELSEVVTIVSPDNQDFSGSPKQGVIAQVVNIAPKKGIGRIYRCTAISYIPFSGGIEGDDFTVDTANDNNLFTITGGNNAVDTYTFIFDGSTYGQIVSLQSINLGSIADGSTINIVCINGAILTCRGGGGGAGDNFNGLNGGTVINNGEGKNVTVNIYLNGTTPDFGNGTYSADGELRASGGGGGGGKDDDLAGGGGGGGGQGSGGGGGGIGSFTGGGPGSRGLNGRSGTATTVGAGGVGGVFQAFTGEDGGDGGSFGNSGISPTLGGNGGLAGKGLDFSAGTINIVTNGDTGRFTNGTGDTPTSLT